MMKIEIYGARCAKCKRMARHAEKAAKQLNIKAEVSKVEDIQKIMEKGIMMTPALVVDGKVLMSGRTSSLDEVRELIKQHM